VASHHSRKGVQEEKEGRQRSSTLVNYETDIKFENEGVRYTEKKPDFRVFIAVLKGKDGEGILAPIMASDAFTAGIIAGTKGKILTLMSLQDFLYALQGGIHGK
jgi:hypothetical protein